MAVARVGAAALWLAGLVAAAANNHQRAAEEGGVGAVRAAVREGIDVQPMAAHGIAAKDDATMEAEVEDLQGDCTQGRTGTCSTPADAGFHRRRLRAGLPSFADEGLRARATEAFMRAVASPVLLRGVLESMGLPGEREGPGELLVAGTGVRLTQLTLETVNAIDAADIVLYSVADAVTESFIRARRPDSIDLHTVYNDGKLGDETDVQIAEAMLAPARLGLRVAAVLFGHPGVADLRGHRAVAIAKREGVRARMLPAVSVSDNLYADLGVDPSSPGMQSVEATDMLLRRRSLDPSSSATVYQVGSVGDPVYDHAGSSNPEFASFAKQLMSTYGGSHRVALYVAAARPLDAATLRVRALGELAAMSPAEVREQVPGTATMYIPPAGQVPLDDETLAREGLEVFRGREDDEASLEPFGYGLKEAEAVRNLTDFSMPAFYEYVERKDTEVLSFMLDLALKPSVQRAFDASPGDLLRSYNITAARLAAHSSGAGGMFFMLVRLIVQTSHNYRCKIMHHHNVVSNYFQSFNKSRLEDEHSSVPVVSARDEETPRSMPNFTGFETRKAATEAFMKAVPSSSRLAETLSAAGITWDRKAPGQLVIVGTGIRASQLTLETLQAIDAADLVLYSVADPVTESFIRRRRPDSFDMYALYGDGKLREETYTQTAEAMLAPARLGLRVVAAFYGHPGVFDFPSHRALAIAHAEGLRARMLPAVSASDNLFADLGVDPSAPGMQTLEATDVLLRKRGLDPTSSALVFQVGGVGDPGFNYTGSSNPKFGALVARLVATYGVAHRVVLYIASRLPIDGPSIRVHSLGELAAMSAAGVEEAVTGITTMFIPAVSQAPLDEEVLSREGLAIYREDQAQSNEPFGYGARELEAVRSLADFAVPRFYRPVEARDSRVSELMLDLALEPSSQRAWALGAEQVLQSYNVTAGSLAAYAEGPAGSHMLKTYRGAPILLPHVLLKAEARA